MAQEPQGKAKETGQASGNVSSSRQEGQRPQQRSFSSQGRPGGGSRPPFRGGQRQGRGGFRRRRFQPRRKVCLYCVNKEKIINWKNTDDFRRFINDSGGIFPRRKTGMCAKHQRRVAIAIKRARHIALLPYTSEHIRFSGNRRG